MLKFSLLIIFLVVLLVVSVKSKHQHDYYSNLSTAGIRHPSSHYNNYKAFQSNGNTIEINNFNNQNTHSISGYRNFGKYKYEDTATRNIPHYNLHNVEDTSISSISTGFPITKERFFYKLHIHKLLY